MKRKSDLLRSSLKAVLGLVSVAMPGLSLAQALEEIVVTAERRETLLQDTPISVLAFDTDTLDAAGIDDIEYLQNISPGLKITGSRGNQNRPIFRIRAIGNTGGSGPTGDRGVGLYIDDIYYPRSTGSLLQTLDVQRIEVLRGPQGTLFGRNNAGGAIRYITNRPHEETEFQVKATMGEFSRADIDLLYNAPISDRVFFRGQISSLNRDGYVQRGDVDLSNVDAQVIRGQLRFAPSDDVTVDLGLMLTKDESNGRAGSIINQQGSTGSGEWGIVQRAIIATDPTQPPFGDDDPRLILDDFTLPNYCLLDGDGDPFTRLSRAEALAGGFAFLSDCSIATKEEMSLASLDINWNISDSMSFRSLTGILGIEAFVPADWAYSGGFISESVEDTDGWSQEFQLSGSIDDRVDWTAGVYLFHEDGTEFRPRLDILDTGGNLRTSVERNESRFIDTDSLGLYGQLTWYINDAFSLTAGVRRTEDDKANTINWSEVRSGTFLPFSGLSLPTEASFSSNDYRLTLDYDINDDVMVFITASTGFQAGQFNDTVNTGVWFDDVADGGNGDGIAQISECIDACRESVRPQEIENLEIGIRAQWLENRLRTNLTVYDMDITDLQTGGRVQIVEPDGTLTTITRSVNAGAAKVRGWEAEIQAGITDNLTLNFAAAKYSQAEITELPPPEVIADSNLVLGERLADTPDLAYTLSLNHAISLSNGGGLDTTVGYSFSDDFTTNQSLPDAITVPDVGIVSARIRYTEPEGRWAVSLSGTNLADEVYSHGGQHYAGARGQVGVAFMARPRALALGFEYYSR